MRTMNTLCLLAAGVGVSLMSACKTLDAPDQNAVTLQALTTGTPTRASVLATAQGLFITTRTAGPCRATCGYLGREGYNLDPSNPQSVPIDFVSGGDLAAWASSYAAIKLANIVIEALPTAVGFTSQEKAGVQGFAQTIKAIDLLFVIQTTDQTGAVLEVPDDPTSAPPNIATTAQVYARILALLDSAQTFLQNAGATLPINFSAGFAGFTTPSTFLQFNRGIRAKVDVYLGNYAAALTDLAGSFIDPTKALSTGVYNTYSTNAGDATNGAYDPGPRQLFAHPSYATDAQLQSGAVPGDTTKRDLRFLAKFRPVTQFSRYGFTLNWGFNIYTSLSSPIPVLKNEELILLRAEANLACTGVAPTPACGGTRAAALTDINTIRVKSGGLTALAVDPGQGGTFTGDLLLDELLYNKRFSLVWEQGIRWLDARKYGVLAKLPHDQAGQVVFPYARLPDNECNARGIPAGSGLCAMPAGL